MIDPTEEQYLTLNGLDTLALLIDYRYDEDTGIFIIRTLSPVLPLAMLRQDGEITPIEPISE